MRPRRSARSAPRPRTRVLAILTGLSTLAVLPLSVGAEALEFRFLVRANLGPQEVQANDNIIDRPAISADGRFVGYDSYATNLTPDDTNGRADVFLYDSLTTTTRRVSTSRTGGAAAGDSTSPSISANGRYCMSPTTRLRRTSSRGTRTGSVACSCGTRSAERPCGRVGTAGSGPAVQGDAGSGFASLSADGSRVAFTSAAENLAPGDTNDAHDIYLRDLTSGVTRLVSLDGDGKQGNAPAGAPALSADGTHVAFEAASRLSPRDHDRSIDVYVRDLTAGTSTLVSGAEVLDRPGAQRGISYGPSISADGRYVAFTSFADDLVPADRNRFQEATFATC